MIGEKTVNIIFDNESLNNLISRRAMEELKLKSRPHTKPYQISWIKHGEGVKISEQCAVKLSIGNQYSDEVHCNIVDMDAAHIILI